MAAIRFYLHFMIWECDRKWNDEVVKAAGGITNYITMLDQLRRSRRDEHVCLVTFNYDRMYDREGASVGRSQH